MVSRSFFKGVIVVSVDEEDNILVKFDPKAAANLSENKWDNLAVAPVVAGLKLLLRMGKPKDVE